MNTRESMDFINDNIIKIISHYIPLANDDSRYRIECPLGCKRDTFIIDSDSKKWECFSCGIRGNAIDFIMKYQKVNFADAVKIGIEILR